jgi:hypothetical protein
MARHANGVAAKMCTVACRGGDDVVLTWLRVVQARPTCRQSKSCPDCQFTPVVYSPLCFLCGFWLDQEGGGSETSGKPGDWKRLGLLSDGNVRYQHEKYPNLTETLTQSEAALYEQRPKRLSAEEKKQRERVRDKLQRASDGYKVAAGGNVSSACSSQMTGGAGSSRSDISASPATAVKPPRVPKRTRPRGRAKKGSVWNGDEYVWNADTVRPKQMRKRLPRTRLIERRKGCAGQVGRRSRHASQRLRRRESHLPSQSNKSRRPSSPTSCANTRRYWRGSQSRAYWRISESRSRMMRARSRCD